MAVAPWTKIRADGEHQQQRGFRGHARLDAAGADFLEVADQDDGGEGDEAGGDRPATKVFREQRAEGAEDGHERERAEARQPRLGALALQADQQAQAEGDAEALENGQDFHALRGS